MTPPPADEESRSFERVDEPRGDVAREWELFVRESSGDPLRHVGSVTAGTAGLAREQAESLFGWRAEAFWLCPADETARFVTADAALTERGHADDGTEASGTDRDTPDGSGPSPAEAER